jgi:HSP20 family protein
MTKQKKSFFEKLTGIKRIDVDQDTIVHTSHRNEYPDTSYLTHYESQEETYEFPSTYEEESLNDQLEEIPTPQTQMRTSQQPQPYYPQSGYAQPMAQPQPIQNHAAMNAEAENESEGQLTIDVYQTDDEIVIKSTIAGVKPEDLDVNINNDMVTIRGERKLEENVDQENYYYQECYWGPFSRSVILPVEIIAEKAEAAMKNGILTIRLPKADITKIRRIQVRGI